jgi:copper chaperone CopZ
MGEFDRPMHDHRSSSTTRTRKTMRTITLATLSILLAATISCGRSDGGSSERTAETPIERVVQEVTINSGVPKVIADLTIEGMSCEMMCGNSIRKALAALPGVEVAEIRFNEGEASDHAVVTYNEDQVDDARMIAAIHALHQGQYKVSAVSITRQVRSQGGSVEEGGGQGAGGDVSSRVPGSSILPGVLALLTRILRG